MAHMAVTVLLLDDHEVVRRGVRELLDAEEDIEVVAEASDGAGALQVVAEALPDVAVLDVQLPDMSGVEVCRAIRAEHPGVRCLMLTSFADDEALDRAVVAGASGYVLKQIRGGDLVDAVRRVSRGESLIPPELAARASERLRRLADQDRRLEGLTPQERRILDLLAEGRSNREIAGTLYLAEKTVKNYVSNLLAKLGMSRRTEAAVYAARLEERRQARP
jgi:two-component system, NarL family, response regulator DevR